MNDFHKNQHSVYRLTYHVVFVVKYRRQAITDEIAAFMEEDVTRLLELKGGSLGAFNHDKDHVHMLIELPPQAAPSVVVCILKTQTAKNIRLQFKEEIMSCLWGDAFWSESYFICLHHFFRKFRFAYFVYRWIKCSVSAVFVMIF